MTAPHQQSDKGSGWGFGIVLGLILLFVAFCSSQQSRVADLNVTSDELASATTNAAEPEAADTPLPLDRSAMIRGAKQLQVIARLDLPGSRQIFSQNCYDALAKAFDWHQLDRCGEFDAMAVRLADVDENMSVEELEYFQSENAATRYLGAATGHGLDGGEADVRWAALETGAQGFRLPTRKVEIVSADGPPEADNDSAATGLPLNAVDANAVAESERSD